MKKTLFSVMCAALVALTTAFAAPAVAPTAPAVVLPANATLLFTQTADYAVLTTAKGSTTTGVLVLHHVSPETTWFTDRPHRLAGVMTTDAFVKQWAVGSNNFAQNNPNANLVATYGKDQSSVLTLSKPVYNATKKTLAYQVKAVKPATLPAGSTRLRDIALFVDSSGCNLFFGCH